MGTESWPGKGASAAVARLPRQLGPGLITGAADDDPSGIATYAQIGAQYGFALGWTILLTTPFMIAVQEIAAQIGRVSGAGLGAAMRCCFPAWVSAPLIAALLLANVINLAADIGAMADATRLVAGGPQWLYAVLFALFCATCEIWLAYKRYVVLLKWLTLALLAYVALLAVIHLNWAAVLRGAFIPGLDRGRAALTALVAVLGTTISPYLFFWQSSEESEDAAAEPDSRPLREHAGDAPKQFSRIRLDTVVGMLYSNLVAIAVVDGTAASLHQHGITDIGTAAQAALALRPIAGQFAGFVFALGIIGTGLLAVPVLAGSAAYGLGEALGWQVGLGRRPEGARAFYAVIAVATLLGTLIVFSPLNPMRALFWSAVLNGIIAGPLIVAMVVLGSRRQLMGKLTLGWRLQLMGWLSALLMVGAAVGMFVT